MNEKELIRAIYSSRRFTSTKSRFFPNVFLHHPYVESDLIEVLPSGYVIEYEIKASRTDLFREYRKERWTPGYYQQSRFRRWRNNCEYIAKKYFFVIPDSIYSFSESYKQKILDYIKPEHGLITVEHVTENYYGQPLSEPLNRIHTARKAKEDRSIRKITDDEMMQMYTKIYFRYWNLNAKSEKENPQS